MAAAAPNRPHPEQHSSFLPEIRSAAEIIPGELYFVSLSKTPVEADDVSFICTDRDYVYENFFADFGPLSLGKLYRYCYALDERRATCVREGKTLYHYTAKDQHKRSNGAFLIAAYSLLRLNRNVEQAFHPFLGCYPPFVPFRDASYGLCTYTVSVLDCLKGLNKAMRCGFFKLEQFDIQSYEFYERVENGDWNWIVPNKFLAFSGPHDARRTMQGDVHTLSAQDYAEIFQRLGVKTVIRLNTPCYDRATFLDAGIQHYDLFFKDGTVPSSDLLRQFFHIAETNPVDVVAIHCKAGLGRTGTLIGAYLMKHHGFTAKEAISWMRIVRPGSVIGPQQHFLEQIAPSMKRQGDRYRSSLPTKGMRVQANDRMGMPRALDTKPKQHAGSPQSRRSPSSYHEREFVHLSTPLSTSPDSPPRLAGHSPSNPFSKHAESKVARDHDRARHHLASLARSRTPHYGATQSQNKHLTRHLESRNDLFIDPRTSSTSASLQKVSRNARMPQLRPSRTVRTGSTPSANLDAKDVVHNFTVNPSGLKTGSRPLASESQGHPVQRGKAVRRVQSGATTMGALTDSSSQRGEMKLIVTPSKHSQSAPLLPPATR
jgi:protein-tyrosine phosphatase